MVTLDHANMIVIKTLSPYLDLNQFILLSLVLKKLITNTQYQFVLMLQIGIATATVSSAIVVKVSITVYSLLDIVVTLIG